MADYIVEIIMRSGDQLPLLAVAVEDDLGTPVDLTAATFVEIVLTNEDGGDPRITPGVPPTPILVLPAMVVDAVKGLVSYDWGQADVLRPGIVQLVVVAHLLTGLLSAPSDRTALITVRPDVRTA